MFVAVVCRVSSQMDVSTSLLRAARSGNVDRVIDLLDSGRVDIATSNAVSCQLIATIQSVHLFATPFRHHRRNQRDFLQKSGGRKDTSVRTASLRCWISFVLLVTAVPVY